MSVKAYKSGSTFPEPVDEGKLRLYSSRICPFSERARLVIAHKNIPHEIVNIDLKDKPEWFLALAPLGKLPTMQLGDKILFDSAAVCEYLDDIYPGEKLQASDPFQKAKNRILLESYGQVTSAYHDLVFPRQGDGDSDDFIETKVKQLRKGLQFYEDELTKRGTPYFGGDLPGMVDYFLWPHMERMPAVTKLVPKVNMCASDFPHLVSWSQTMSQLPAVKKEMHEADWHIEVFKLIRAGKSAGDYGLPEGNDAA